MSQKRRPDVASLVGIPVAIGLILIGQALEGGHVQSLVQLTAALIVFGGTLGAVLLGFSQQDVIRAVTSLRDVFSAPFEGAEPLIDKIVGYATRARKQGIMTLEDELAAEPDPFLKKGLALAVDGTNPHVVRDMLTLESHSLEDHEEVPARVYEAAGGYAPTVGILGAVLGLIHVMENLNDPSKLGSGIAVAFVATVYGVGAANLVFLPIATKLKARGRDAAARRELIIEGILAIQEGLNIRLIEEKLRGLAVLPPAARKGSRPAAKAA
ncbi:MAG: flagellar motor protein [Vicinamibacterales bacterium]|nr:flagellar motor protein [Vicinamibacterales bacterium]